MSNVKEIDALPFLAIAPSATNVQLIDGAMNTIRQARAQLIAITAMIDLASTDGGGVSTEILLDALAPVHEQMDVAHDCVGSLKL